MHNLLEKNQWLLNDHQTFEEFSYILSKGSINFPLKCDFSNYNVLCQDLQGSGMWFILMGFRIFWPLRDDPCESRRAKVFFGGGGGGGGVGVGYLLHDDWNHVNGLELLPK